MTGIRMALFALSTVGGWEILRRRARFHVRFLPSLAVAAQCCLLLLAGLLNLLPEMTAVLFAAGLGGLVYYTVREKGKNLLAYGRPEFLFLLAGLLFLLVFLRGKVFTHYDNFSHWATVVKTMLEDDRFPNFETSLVSYRGYPLGSSVFVYYAAKLTGGGEPTWMLGQGYMLLTCMLPLFRPEGKNRWPGFLVMLFAGNFFLDYNVQPTELLVDTLLPLAGMCALLFAHAYGKTGGRAAPYAALYLVWLTQIKNAGIFFALLAGLAFLVPARREKKTLWGLGCLAAALLSLLIWNRHCSYVFAGTGTAQHSLSLSWWEAAFQAKSVEDIKHIILKLGEYAFTSSVFWSGVLLAAGTCLCALLAAGPDRGRYFRRIALAGGLYLVYQAGLLIMYVFSMPRGEAFILSSVDRYEKTIVIAMGYLMTAMILKLLAETDRPALIPAAVTALAGLSLCASLWTAGSVPAAWRYQPYRIGSYDGLEVRTWLSGLKEKHGIPDREDYTFLIEGWDSDFFYYLGAYVFDTTNVKVMENAAAADLKKISTRYVLIHDRENEAVRTWLGAADPEREEKGIICLME